MKKRKLRNSREIEEALGRLRPLEGDPVVDAVVATLRWVLAEAEGRDAFGALATKHSPGDERKATPAP
ncbi:MAG: hypothetical protein U0166_15190 [Acidobacteriota bacterium]